MHWLRFNDPDRVSSQFSANWPKLTSSRDYSGQANNPSNGPAGDPTLPVWTGNGQNGRNYAQFTKASGQFQRVQNTFAGVPAGTGGLYCWQVVKYDAPSLANYVMTSTYNNGSAAAYDSGTTLRKNNTDNCQFWLNATGVGIIAIATANTLGTVNTYYLEGWVDPGAKVLKCTISAGTGGNAATSAVQAAAPTNALALLSCGIGTQAQANADLFGGRIYEVGLAKGWTAAQQAATRSYIQGFYNL